MPIKRYRKKLLSSNREDIRNEVINWFHSENSVDGYKVIYTVETYDGHKIELHRIGGDRNPDFVVHIKTFKFYKNEVYTNPSIDDIIQVLESVKVFSDNLYNERIKPIVQDFYNCKDITLSPHSIGEVFDHLAYFRPVEIVLLALKWLFIEQDVVYWNDSGREKFYSRLKERDLI